MIVPRSRRRSVLIAPNAGSFGGVRFLGAGDMALSERPGSAIYGIKELLFTP
jgi:hypothetical protein